MQKVLARIGTHDIVDRAMTGAKIALGTITLDHLGPGGLVEVTRTTDTTINDVTLTTITWETEATDAQGYITVPGTTLVVPTGYGGLYVSTIKGAYTAAVGARAFAQVIVNGVTSGRSSFGNNAEDSFSTTALLRLAGADTLVVQLFHSTGAARTLDHVTWTLARFSAVAV